MTLAKTGLVVASFQNAVNVSQYNQSEDCLFLNVYAPSTPAPPEGRTVILWYYGGGFQLGTANVPDFNGSHLAKNYDVIIVEPNYRTSGKLPLIILVSRYILKYKFSFRLPRCC